jgi:hypothetical protein
MVLGFSSRREVSALSGIGDAGSSTLNPTQCPTTFRERYQSQAEELAAAVAVAGKARVLVTRMEGVR